MGFKDKPAALSTIAASPAEAALPSPLLCATGPTGSTAGPAYPYSARRASLLTKLLEVMVAVGMRQFPRQRVPV